MGEKTEQRDQRVATAAAGAAALSCLAGSAAWFLYAYSRVLSGFEAADMPEARTLITWLFPALSDLGMVAGAMWIAAAAGTRRREAWAPPVAMVAGALALISGMFPTFPSVRLGIFPLAPLAVALPNLALLCLVLGRGAGLPRRRVGLAVMIAFAALFTFIIGVASTHRILSHRGDLYTMVQRPHFMLCVGWIAAAAALVAGAGWARWAGLILAALSVLLGAPVAVNDSVALGRFSMFGVSPIYAAVVGLTLLRAGGGATAPRSGP